MDVDKEKPIFLNKILASDKFFSIRRNVFYNVFNVFYYFQVGKNRCKPHNPCQHKCNDNGVEVKCSCRRGYELMVDGTSCQGMLFYLFYYSIFKDKES